MEKEKFIQRAIELASENIRTLNGGPFGAVITKNGLIVSEGANQVVETNDPTAHAEIVAIRKAAQKLGSYNLNGCVLYSSCEPCPMCLGAVYWCGIQHLVFAADRNDALAAGFRDALIYDEIGKRTEDRYIIVEQSMQEKAVQVFQDWIRADKKINY